MYSIGLVLATAPVLATNPSYSPNTYQIYFIFFFQT